jgi:hypothetical protein
MYIPTTFSAGSRLTPSLGDASLVKGVRNLGFLDKVNSILHDRSRRMMKPGKRDQEVNVLSHNPLNKQNICIHSFQGFGNGHILHRTS